MECPHFKWERPGFEAVGLSMRRLVALKVRLTPVKVTSAKVEPRPTASNLRRWDQSDAIGTSTGVTGTFTSVTRVKSATRGFRRRDG